MTANITPSTENTAAKKGSSRFVRRLRTAGVVLRLAGHLPGIMLKASRSYRRYRDSFLKAAMAEGMPKELARALAREAKPGNILRGLHSANKKKSSR
jgi:hypothetical protein